LVETEFFHPSPVFENHHHEDLMANGERKSPHLIFINASFIVIFPLTTNLFQNVSYHSNLPLISDQKATILRC
jgi:hypothetical protein